MNTSKEQLFDDLLSAAECLIVTHHVTQDEIKNKLKEKLELLSKSLPRVQVLYSTSYGGFGFNETFQQFLSLHGVEGGYFHDERCGPVTTLVSKFGQELGDTHPALLTAIMHHHYYNMDTPVNSCLAVTYLHETRLMLQSILQQVQATPDTLFMEDHPIPTHWVDFDKSFHCLKHDKHELIDQLRILIEQQTDDIANANVGIFATQPAMQQEMVHLHSVKHNPKMYRLAQGLSFADAYDQLGPHCKEVWEKQGHLNTTAMLFLMNKLTTTADGADIKMDLFTNEPLLLTEQDMLHCYQVLGLLFASDQYAHLRICEVPALVTWKIHEYDGRESIRW